MASHCEVLDCVESKIRDWWEAENVDPYHTNEIRTEHYGTKEPGYGITIIPDGDMDLPGTNESTDISYSCLVVRRVHSLGNEDMCRQLNFRDAIRKIFHRKKWSGCVSGCMVVSTVDFGSVKLPREWVTDNESVSAIRVKILVREQNNLGL